MISEESVKYSLRNLSQRKARSFLTILSIFIGITTIFIFISFGLGLYNYMEDMTSSSSADKILIQPKGGIGIPGMDNAFPLTDDDVEAVRKTHGVYDATGVYMKVVEIQQGKVKKYTFLIGIDPAKPFVMEMSDVEVEVGRDLKPGETGKIVAGYNYQLKDVIFPKTTGINQNIEIDGKNLKVVGFYESIGSPPDDAQLYTTLDYLEDLYPDDNLSYGMIIAKVDTTNLDKVSENIEKSLRKERDLDKGKEDFSVQSFTDLLESFSVALNMVIGFIILIALISVLVSAVNTANTMITSVLERVKEIGIIKSIGARNSTVFGIFLFESGFLGLIAGVVGVGLGWGASALGESILDSLGWGFLAPAFPIELFVGLILFATITGAISGVFPAYRASKTNIVDALRYE
jgi:putative ABC transport system permease protein|tara:strand:- start:8977 stop:10188 length:1212 start_codon:yes stop_codon:yes gene_type:complete